jgi:Protein of unknown function (DUF992)
MALAFCPPTKFKQSLGGLNKMRRSMLGAAMVSLLLPMVSADASPLQAGFLECQGGRSVGYILGSVAELDCVYRSRGRPPQPYIATIRRFGLDLGVTEQTRFAWAVSAPVNRFERGELAGSYGGVGASASVGVGFGGNFLVGGPGNSYSLQPISMQGQTGFNLAAGVAGIELKPILSSRGAPRLNRSRHHLQG